MTGFRKVLDDLRASAEVARHGGCRIHRLQPGRASAGARTGGGRTRQLRHRPPTQYGLAEHRPDLANAEPEYGEFRPGDVRHSQADIAKARQRLGYAPTYSVLVRAHRAARDALLVRLTMGGFSGRRPGRGSARRELWRATDQHVRGMTRHL